MATFQAQIEGLTGLSIGTSPTTGEVTQFLTDGVLEVTDRIIRLSPGEVSSFLRQSAEQTSNGFNPGTNKVISVLRETGTNNDWRPCTLISSDLQSRVNDVGSLYYASKYSPVYYITQNRNVHVAPDPGGSDNTYKVLYVNTDPENGSGNDLGYGDNTIKWFPEDKVYLVVIYAAIRSLGNALSALETDPSITLPTPPTAPIGPEAPSIASSGITTATASFEGMTAPIYIEPTVTLSSTPTIPDLDISVVPPIPPELSSSVADFTTARSIEPTYTEIVKPEFSTTVSLSGVDTTLDFSGVSIPEMPLNVTNQINETGITNPTFTVPPLPDLNYTDVSTWITAEEDAEMSAARVQEIQTKIQQHQDEVQAEVARWSNENAILQKDLNIAQQNAQHKSEEYANTIQNFATDVQRYQTDVNKIIQAHQAEQTILVQAYQAEISTDLQKHLQDLNAYNIEVQNSVNSFNKEVTIYQSEVQKALADSDTLNVHRGNQIQLYQAKIAEYQNQISKDVQEFTNNLTKEIQLWQVTRNTDIQKYNADIQNAVSTFNKESSIHQSEVQRRITNAQLLAQEYREEASLELQASIQEYASKLQKYSAELTEYQNDVQKYSAESGIAIQEFNSELQRYNLNYGWMQSRQGELKQQYETAFQIMAPRQPQEA